MPKSRHRRTNRKKKAGIIICLLSVSLTAILTLLVMLICHPELFGKRHVHREDGSAAKETAKRKGWNDIIEWDWTGKSSDNSNEENDPAVDADIRKAAAEGYLKAAEVFAKRLTETGLSAEDDARYGLFDMDCDSIPELIMHDLTGEYACFCSYRNGNVTEPSVLFDNHGNESSFKSCALFTDRNIQLIYEISGGDTDDPYSQTIKTDICGLDADGIPVVRDSILMKITAGGDELDIRYEQLSPDGDREIGRDEYLSILADHAGEDIIQRFRIDEGLTDIIEGAYDLGVGKSEAGTGRLQRLTLGELGEVLADIADADSL